MAIAPSFELEELTGQRRSVTLRTRGLPYQSPNWTGRQRAVTTWYAGNPQATIQVLGPEELPSNFEGMWKDRFITEVGTVEVRGFDEIESARDLVEIFDQIRQGGNRVRVQWGTFVRSGILSQFEAKPIRLEDIRWTMEFTWDSKDDAEAPRATTAQRPQSELREAQNGVDDLNAFRPPTVDLGFATASVTAIKVIRGLVSEQLDSFREARKAVDVPLEAAQGASSAAQSIRSAVEAERETLADGPYTALQVSDTVVEVLQVEKWRRGTSARLRVLSSRSLVESRALEREYAPPGFRIVTMPAHGSLRRLSLDVYENADDWPRLARANGFKTSSVEPGTVLLVPPRGTRVA